MEDRNTPSFFSSDNCVKQPQSKCWDETSAAGCCQLLLSDCHFVNPGNTHSGATAHTVQPALAPAAAAAAAAEAAVPRVKARPLFPSQRVGARKVVKFLHSAKHKAPLPLPPPFPTPTCLTAPFLQPTLCSAVGHSLLHPPTTPSYRDVFLGGELKFSTLQAPSDTEKKAGL